MPICLFRILLFLALSLSTPFESWAVSQEQIVSRGLTWAIVSTHDQMDMSNITPEQAIKSLPEPLHLSNINGWESLQEHIHNKLVHFPLALGLLACLFWLLSFKHHEFQISAKLMLVLGAATGLLAILTGENQKQVFQDSPLVEIMQWHEKIGFLSFFLLLSGSVWQFFQSFRKFVFLYTAILILCLLFVGFLGGFISHSHLDSAKSDQSHSEINER